MGRGGEMVEKGVGSLKICVLMILGSFEVDLMTFWKSNVIKMEISARSTCWRPRFCYICHPGLKNRFFGPRPKNPRFTNKNAAMVRGP